MAQTKDEIAAERDALAAERDQLAAERDQLAAQLAAAGSTTRVAQARPQRPWLTEGERQELAAYGIATSPVTGEVMTTEQARERFPNVEIPDAKPGAVREAAAVRRRPAPREGVDYVYPSVAPGQLAGDVGAQGDAARPAPAVDVDGQGDGE